MAIKKIKRILILGGGSSGWMTAAALAHFLPQSQYNITLVESDQIGTIGVGEATIPHIRYFNQTLGIDEREFVRRTHATFKLGIELSNWGAIGESYIHPFGDFGEAINNVSFHHYWRKLNNKDKNISLFDFSLPIVAAKLNKFQHPHPDKRSLLSMYGYAYHLDASLYAKFLREYSELRGIVRKEGLVKSSELHKESGSIKAVFLESGEKLEADFFIDCSGFRGVLIEQELKTGYDDWSKYFLCDRAVAVQSEKQEESAPYTKSIAQPNGWQWKIPLQHRMGNGYVYSSQFSNDEDAQSRLLKNIHGTLLNDPKIIRFQPGVRKKSWNKNCVAIGLSAGFLEPLESTSLFLVQVGIMKLLEFLPTWSLDNTLEEEYNRIMKNEYERIKDFLILHYVATTRNDSEFWNYVRTMDIPDSLTHKIELFRELGEVEYYKEGLFLNASWISVFVGQGVIPKTWNRAVDSVSTEKLFHFLAERKSTLEQAARSMNSHEQTIENMRKQNGTINTLSPSMSLYGL